MLPKLPPPPKLLLPPLLAPNAAGDVVEVCACEPKPKGEPPPLVTAALVIGGAVVLVEMAVLTSEVSTSLSL